MFVMCIVRSSLFTRSCLVFFFFLKQMTAYELRISDWSSDVCSSDLSEGYPALIQVGQSVPLTTQGTDGYGQIYQQTQYRDVLRGFYATATVHGDRVQVTISSTRDRLAQGRGGVVEVQNADTRVSGRIGEWITIGGVDESASSEQQGTLRRYSTQGGQNLSMRLKVDVLD